MYIDKYIYIRFFTTYQKKRLYKTMYTGIIYEHVVIIQSTP